MVMENYDRIVEKISKKAGLEKDEIERRIEAKRAKLSGLISRDGAAQIVAAELGISFDNEKLKLEELLPGMRKVNTRGKVTGFSPVRTFKTKKGDDGKVVNLFLADETTNLKVVLWDTNHISLIETGKISEGIVVEILNGAMRENELHLGSFSELKISSETIDSVNMEKVFRVKNISELKTSDNVKIRAFVVQSFDPKFFYVCPSCRKKVIPEGNGYLCAEHGKVTGEKRALSNVILDDGTESIRAVAFHDNLAKLGLTEFENPEELLKQRESLIGKEMFFSGSVRSNKMFNTPEFTIEGAEIIDLDSLIKELETN